MWVSAFQWWRQIDVSTWLQRQDFFSYIFFKLTKYTFFLFSEMLTRTSGEKFCPLPCSTMRIHFGFPVYGIAPKDEAFVKLYFKNQINVSNSRLSYDELSFFAEVAAYFGIFLGFALLDLGYLIKRTYLLVSNRRRIKSSYKH